MDPPLWLVGAWEQYLRVPTSFDTSTIPATPTWDPPHTTYEQATLAMLQALWSASLDLTLADWVKIAAILPDIRAFRQLTRPAVMAMTQTDRDKLYFDTLSDMAHLFVILLRDATA